MGETQDAHKPYLQHLYYIGNPRVKEKHHDLLWPPFSIWDLSSQTGAGIIARVSGSGITIILH
jgi:hypothetical protein